jgi:hypothetical protein
MELFRKNTKKAVMDSKVFNYEEIPSFFSLDLNVSNESPGLANYDALRDAIGMAEGKLGELFKAFGRCSVEEGVPDNIALVCQGLFEEFTRVANFRSPAFEDLQEQFNLTDDLSKYR